MRDTQHDIEFKRGHESEQECAAAVERLEKETTAKTYDLLSVLGCGAIGSPVNNKADFLFLTKCSKQLKEYTGKTFCTIVYYSEVDQLTSDGCSPR